ncbi:Rrf2 family transcriptional regulator [Leptolyngbya sp. FACHB-1515]
MPERYLEQVLMSLRRGGIVQSLRGAKGGYVLAREAWKITLVDIFQAIEGEPNSKDNQSNQMLGKKRSTRCLERRTHCIINRFAAIHAPGFVSKTRCSSAYQSDVLYLAIEPSSDEAWRSSPAANPAQMAMSLFECLSYC